MGFARNPSVSNSTHHLGSNWSTLLWLVVGCIFCIHIYLEPTWPLFLKVNPPQWGLFLIKNKGHLGSRYADILILDVYLLRIIMPMYLFIYILSVFYLQQNSSGCVFLRLNITSKKNIPRTCVLCFIIPHKAPKRSLEIPWKLLLKGTPQPNVGGFTWCF